MKKILLVALREFTATVVTKGFIIGMVLMPVVILISIVGIKAMIENEKPPRIEGQVAIIDPTGQVYEGVVEYLDPESFAERREEYQKRVNAETPAAIRQIAGETTAAQDAIDSILGEVPRIDVVRLDPQSDLGRAKEPLMEDGSEDGKLLALIVIHDDAVVKAEDQERFGKFDLFVREKLDDRIEDEIKQGTRDAIVEARVRSQGLDRERIDALTKVGRVKSTTVTREGEKETNEMFNALLPAGFILLLFVSVMSSGQYIMTSTVEEKSSRVVEVLLSAVSPMQLMAGKVLGQMCVGFVILGVYAGMGVGALFVFALIGALDLWLLFYMVIFYLIAYFIIGSLMAAIGAAVNEVREAQTFMAPLMIVLMIPWLLWMPISRDPNSVFATVLSFLPPMNTFVMLLRMASSTPPPWWQVWLSIFAGAAGVFLAIWFAAKVFRIGLLMYGKPPDFKTLVRWVRMA